MTKHIAQLAACIALLTVLASAQTEVRGPTREDTTRSAGGSSARIDVVLYVDDDGDPAGDCLTWNTACPDLQVALDYAFTQPEVKEIRVAGGTYYPDRGTGIRAWTFQLLDNLALNGGYRGCPGGDCTDANDHDIAAFESILSGEIGNPDITTDNSYHVVTGTATNATASIDGFTITAGRADGSPPHDDGAGFINTGGSPLVSYCTFADHYALDDGAGMSYNGGGADLVLTACTFTGNSCASSAAGLDVSNCPSITLVGCAFTDNSAGGNIAGGMNIGASGDATLIDCTFSGNSAPNRGGGLHMANSGYLSLSNCLFSNNNVSTTGANNGLGGGVHCDNAITADNCTFTNNSASSTADWANNSGRGGALHCYTSVVLSNCIFTSNSASGEGQHAENKGLGGAVFCASAVASDCTFGDNLAWGNNTGLHWHTDAGRGGAIFASNDATLTRCVFTQNAGEYYWGYGTDTNALGGAVYTGTLEADDCEFIGNWVWDGEDHGGRGGAVWAVQATLENSVFATNSASGNGSYDGKGGAVYIDNGSTVATGCTFEGNTAEYRGGAMYLYDATDTITNCTFSNNSTVVSGGGAIVRETIKGDPGAIVGCVFENNASGCAGGAVRQFAGTLDFDNCTFVNNSADCDGGAILLGEGSSPMISGCSFHGNTALGSGGALGCTDGSSPTMVNCVLTGNQAGIGGGAVYCLNNSNALLANSSFFSNTAGALGGAMYIDNSLQVALANCILWDDSPNEVYDINNQVQINYCDIQGGWPTGEGNINANPMCVRDPDPGPDGVWGTGDDDYGVLRLLSNSPCIDAADNNRVPADALDLDCDGYPIEPVPLDHDGNLRFHDDPNTVDTDLPNDDYPEDIVDMGAYEFGAPPLCPWDLNCDGSVGILDLLALLAKWGPCPGCPGDLNGDGNVGILDLLALLANWGPCP